MDTFQIPPELMGVAPSLAPAPPAMPQIGGALPMDNTTMIPGQPPTGGISSPGLPTAGGIPPMSPPPPGGGDPILQLLMGSAPRMPLDPEALLPPNKRKGY